MNEQQEKPTVMVVDDTPANLDLLTEMIQGHGYRVQAFPRGGMALKAAALNPPDLILLDIMMPGMDGFEVCLKLKADDALKEIPVIFVTSLTETADKVRAFSIGGVDYVTKPFQQEEVLARVKTHLSLRRQQMQIQESYDRLRELEELRDNLVQLIVHDMRSPLMGMLGNTQLLEMDLKGMGLDELASNVKSILTSGRILQEMISALLDISRLESHEMSLKRETCDLRAVISDAMASLGALVSESTIVYEPPAHRMDAFCDPEITRRIVENLIANAVKFTGKNGEIRIGLSREEAGVRVTVSDTGPGIPPEYHKRIFEKFGQVAARKEGKKYSTGLGLTFCKLAAEAQGGHIGVESEVGKGSMFWFTAPVASA